MGRSTLNRVGVGRSGDGFCGLKGYLWVWVEGVLVGVGRSDVGCHGAHHGGQGGLTSLVGSWVGQPHFKWWLVIGGAHPFQAWWLVRWSTPI